MGRPGRKPKDKKITDKVNPRKKYSLKELRELQKQKSLLDMVRAKANEDKNREKAISATTEGGGEEDKKKKGRGKRPKNLEGNFNYKMLSDMRWVYLQLGGKEELKKFVKGDPKAYELMVKEMMKMESALMAAKVRKEALNDGIVSGNVFVVLKGLEDAERVNRIIPGANGEGTIDMRSIGSVLSPDGSVYEVADEQDGQEKTA